MKDPKNYPKDDGFCSAKQLSYLIWYQGRPREIGSLSEVELQGALLDAQNDLNLVCLRLYRVVPADDLSLMIVNRHRVTSDEEEALRASGSFEPGTDGASLEALYPERKL